MVKLWNLGVFVILFSDDPYKQQPIVLILYSYDCDAHERVVIELANYLRFVANCDVMFDVWDQHLVQEQSIFSWIQDKVDIAQFIIIICSTGARFKCVRTQTFRMKQDRPIPDSFSWAVDLIGEKIRTDKKDGVATSRYVVAYFDYAGHSDIPPKLDNAKMFSLTKDIFSLYCHLHGLKPDIPWQDANMNGITTETYSQTEEGKALDKAITKAKEYFKKNPNWLGQILEPLTPVIKTPPKQIETEQTEESGPKSQSETSDSPDGKLKKSPSTSSDEERRIESRQKKRQQEKEGKIVSVPSREILSPVHSISTPGSQVTPSSSSVSSSSPLMPQTQQTALPPSGTSGKNGNSSSQGSLHHVVVNIQDYSPGIVDEEAELQKDIDFINNFDATNHRYSGYSYASDILNDHDFGGYTPPEDFRALASLEEEANRYQSLLAINDKTLPHMETNGLGQFVIDLSHDPSKQESNTHLDSAHL